MYVLLSGGTGSQAVAEALREYYTHKSKTCYVYNYLQPVLAMHDAVAMVIKNYDARFYPGAGWYDDALLTHLQNWIYRALPEITAKQIYEAVHKWEQHRLFYIAVIHDVLEDAVAEVLPPSFKVFISDNPSVDNSARETVFDLILNSESSTPTQLAESIGAALHHRLFGDKQQPIQDESSADAI